MTLRASLLPLSLLSLGLVACDSPPPPSEVRARITSDLGHVLGQTAAAQAGATAALPGSALLDRLDPSGTTSLRVVRSLASRFLPARRPLAQPRLAPADEPPGFDTDAIVAQLNQTLFTDANHAGGGIYRVPVALACEQTTFDDLGNEQTSIDPDCAANWDTLQLRIRVRDDGDGLAFAIQLGAAHDEPLEIGLRHTQLSLTIDLDEAEAAIEALATALGETAPNAALAGRVTASLTVLGTAHVGAALTIERALAIAVADEGQALDGADAFRLSSAAGPLLSMELDGTAEAARLELGLGATALHVPGADGFELDLPGATLSAELAAGQPLQLTNLSLGDRTTTLRRGGALAMAIDLNADAGRTLAATLTADAQSGLDTLTVTPKFDLQLAIGPAGEASPVYDVTRVLLDGSVRAGDASEHVEVVTGTFAISTNPASFGFSATAGQCVSSSETYDADLDAFYTAWSTGSCL